MPLRAWWVPDRWIYYYHVNMENKYKGRKINQEKFSEYEWFSLLLLLLLVDIFKHIFCTSGVHAFDSWWFSCQEELWYLLYMWCTPLQCPIMGVELSQYIIFIRTFQAFKFSIMWHENFFTFIFHTYIYKSFSCFILFFLINYLMVWKKMYITLFRNPLKALRVNDNSYLECAKLLQDKIVPYMF